MLGLLELCSVPVRWVWVLGSLLLLGRALHAAGLSRSAGYSVGRFWGTAITWIALLCMALAGIWVALA